MSDDKLNEPTEMVDKDSVEHNLLRKTADLLERKDDSLDAVILSRLNKARSAALERNGGRQLNWMQFGGTVAAAALVTVVLQINPDSQQDLTSETLPQLVDSEPANIDDFELLASAADLELLEELDFYMWLDSDEGVEA
ncbi:MAG: hypothetical protein AAF542_23750 [Pseudomonadota bacterium]